MEKVKLEVEVAKEIHELASVLVELVKVTKESLKDGFQLEKDIAPILTIAVSKLPTAVDGIDKISEELKADPVAFSKAIALATAELAEILLKKEAVVAPQPPQA